jgi:DNA-binding SARP family transcriptional activator/TolB-like protein
MTSAGTDSPTQPYLKAFGTVDITDRNGAVMLSVLAQPMRCAVLAYLAIESSNGFQSRDRLTAMFWPESDIARSRRSLNQLLYSLRQALGAEIIDKRGEDQLGINRRLLRCDVVDFLELLDRGELAQALDLYSGDLLEGFFLSKTPEFERWLDAKRAEFRSRAASASWQIADRHRAAGDGEAAGVYARKAAAFTPFDEAALQRLLQFLDAVGQRATAIQEYRAFETRMKAELEVEPSPETRSIVESIRERAVLHERFTPPSLELPRQATVPTVTDESAIPLNNSGLATPKVERHSSLRWRATLMVGVLALAIGAALSLRDNSDSPTPPTSPTLDPRRVAVLFFDDISPSAGLGWLARGLTRDLIHDLSALDTLHVVSVAGVRPFRDLEVPIDSIARALRVGTIVDGTVRVDISGRLQVTVQLVDATADYRTVSRRFEQPPQALHSLQSEILFGINSFLRERIGHAAIALRRRGDSRNVEAWRLVQEAEELLESGIAQGRLGYSQRAWTILASADSMFAHASTLERNWVDPWILRARVARAQNLSLTIVDPVPGQLPGSAGMHQMALDRIAVGLNHVEQALRLDAGHPEASTLEGYFLFWRWFVTGQSANSKDVADAESKLRDVVRNHPDQPLAWVILSRVHRSRGDTAEADQAAQRAFAADPFLYEGRRAIVDLMNQHVERGRTAEARALCESARANYADDVQLLECRLMILAWSAMHRDSVGAAWRELASIERLGFPGLATTWTMRRMYVAAIAARSGLSDSAYAIVERAYANRGANRADSTLAAIAEAWVHLLSRERQRAVRLVDSIVTANAGQRDRIAMHPWFTALRGDTDFARIVGSRAGAQTTPRR